MGELEDEEWEVVLASCKLLSPKLSDRLTQLYILHRSYMTPIRLSRCKQHQDTSCPRCGESSGSFYHLLWSCPIIQGYWTQVVWFFDDRMGSPLTLCPKQCLLGLLPDPESIRHHHIFLQETLFTARLLITRVWLQASSPILWEWMAAVNLSLPYKNVIYIYIENAQKNTIRSGIVG